MARVIYVGPSDAVDLIDGTRCEKGVAVTVADWLAKSLLDQDVWATPPASVETSTPKPNKPAEPEKASK
jgi:hypothetical protein